jgi:YbgC/YbaW family acyl-CoA thioester hydrolase
MNTESTLEPTSKDKIRFYDCDPFGHLNNSRYLDYILNAREIHLKDFYGISLDEAYRAGTVWVISGHEILYLKPAVFNEMVCIQTSLFSASETQVRVEGIMFNENKSSLKAVLWTKFTCVQLATGKKQPHTPEFMGFAKRVMHPAISEELGLSNRVRQLLENLK